MSKRIILFVAVLCMSTAARGQWVVVDPSAIAQGVLNSSDQLFVAGQTAESMLKTFNKTVDIYEQGKAYYDKLRAVNNLVREARKVQRCILMVGEITGLYVDNYKLYVQDRRFTPDELAAIASGYTQLLRRASDALADLQQIINPTTLMFTDKDRFDLVDKTYDELSRCRSLTAYYTQRTTAVAYIRARDANDLERAAALYGTDREKYW